MSPLDSLLIQYWSLHVFKRWHPHSFRVTFAMKSVCSANTCHLLSNEGLLFRWSICILSLHHINSFPFIILRLVGSPRGRGRWCLAGVCWSPPSQPWWNAWRLNTRPRTAGTWRRHKERFKTFRVGVKVWKSAIRNVALKASHQHLHTVPSRG